MTDANTTIVAESFRERLRHLACPAHRQGMEGYFATDMALLGVKTPLLRAEVRKLAKELSAQPADAVLRVATRLVESGVFEERQAAYELLARHKAAFGQLDRSALEELGRGNDNWASVDTLACLLAGPRWLEGGLQDADAQLWVASGDLWWRRTAVVCTTTLNKKSHGGTGDPLRTFAVLRPVLTERHPMIVKAVSWALRQLVDWVPDQVTAFLLENDPELAPMVKREVRNKLTTGRKSPHVGRPADGGLRVGPGNHR